MYVQVLISLLCCGLNFVRSAPAPTQDKAAASIEARGSTYPSRSGRLFNIAGKVQYFSGSFRYTLLGKLLLTFL